jgi:hypothetical protein
VAKVPQLKDQFDKINQMYRKHKSKFPKSLKSVRKGGKTTIACLKSDNIGIVSSTEGKLGVAMQHYINLFKGNSNPPIYDEDFQKHVNSEVESYYAASFIDEGKVELNEAPDLGVVSLAIKQAPNGKAGSRLEIVVNELPCQIPAYILKINFNIINTIS